jgi:biotin transporter BioY
MMSMASNIFIPFTPVGLLFQSLIAATCARLLGVRTGAIAYLASSIVCEVLALLFVQDLSQNAAMFIGATLTFGLPLIILAATLGLASGAKLRQGRRLLALALISPTVLYWSGFTAFEAGKKDEWSRVMEFVKANPVVIQTAGEHLKVYPGSSIGSTRYEVSVVGTINTSAIVDVSRPSFGAPHFSLSCLTAVLPGQRDPFKDICAQ